MNMKHFVHAAAVTAAAVLAFASTANAAVIYSTNMASTGFNGTGSLILNSSAGRAATLTFLPTVNASIAVPSNVSLGAFQLACSACTTQAGGLGATFSSFTFDLTVTDGNGVGNFTGTSAGGGVFSDASLISIIWAPLIIGPGTTNATSGNFGTTTFTTTALSSLVAPNTGVIPGRTTVQGRIDATATPEPATWSLLGGSLLGFGLMRRRMIK